ncbi:uncharacterized protein E0L32_003304 [Thyridium curvatum]|uniref:Uncharacterized protein n=1 Tax=Thyridium curvatum TaxID=1093900 RepID=A0A507BD45_9PEZI|nr:uncharacterized protein E0L32_003304 [Thyridium curvatum]TPX17186.1 hypothetical protein E0L32_003304 [Thyridium curvatum]
MSCNFELELDGMTEDQINWMYTYVQGIVILNDKFDILEASQIIKLLINTGIFSILNSSREAQLVYKMEDTPPIIRELSIHWKKAKATEVNSVMRNLGDAIELAKMRGIWERMCTILTNATGKPVDSLIASA